MHCFCNLHFSTKEHLLFSSYSIVNINPFRWKSHYFDVESGLYYANGRYYDPEVGQYVDASPIEAVEENAYVNRSLDRNNILCNNVFLLVACLCGIFTIEDLSPDPTYDPLDDESWFSKLIYKISSWYNSLHLALKFIIGIMLLVVAIVLIWITKGAAAMPIIKQIVVGATIGSTISAGYEVAKQLRSNGGDFSFLNGEKIALAALGGGLAGAISCVSYGSGFVAYLTTFISGGTGSLIGGIISGSVTDSQSALIAFGVGSFANVIARGFSELINKGIATSAQKTLNTPIYEDLSLADLAASGIENNGYNPVYNNVLNEGGDLVLKATGGWARTFMYSFINAGISSLLSGWY